MPVGTQVCVGAPGIKTLVESWSPFRAENASFSGTVCWQIPFLNSVFFGQVDALFRFAVIARSWFPVLAAFGVDPDLIGMQERRHGDRWRNLYGGWLRADVGFISIDPVYGDRLLGCLEVELPFANQFMEFALQPVLHLGVPRRSSVRLRPEIFDRIGTAEFQWYQVIDLVIAGPVQCDCVFSVNFELHLRRNIAHLFGISGNTDVVRADWECVTWCHLQIGENWRGLLGLNDLDEKQAQSENSSKWPAHFSQTSTRRFFSRPSSVALEATGTAEPKPVVVGK
jgi:hypothetical protein